MSEANIEEQRDDLSPVVTPGTPLEQLQFEFNNIARLLNRELEPAPVYVLRSPERSNKP